MDVDALYARHREALLLFLARRTADPQLALSDRRGRIEQRALARLKLEREPTSPELLAAETRRQERDRGPGRSGACTTAPPARCRRPRR